MQIAASMYRFACLHVFVEVGLFGDEPDDYWIPGLFFTDWLMILSPRELKLVQATNNNKKKTRHNS